MGSPISPDIANIYMEYFESLTIPSSPTLIKQWFRYVDNIHSATRKDQVVLGHIHQHMINSSEITINQCVEAKAKQLSHPSKQLQW